MPGVSDKVSLNSQSSLSKSQSRATRKVGFPFVKQDTLITNDITEDTVTNMPDESALSSSSKMHSQITGSQFNDKASSKRSSPGRSQTSNTLQNALRSYSITKVQQRMIEMKIKEFREKMTPEQIQMLYERSFSIKDVPKPKLKREASK